MRGTHEIFDDILFAALLIFPVYEWRWGWPRYLARLASGAPGVRLRYYRNILAGEWIPALALLGFWALRDRPWSWLLLGGDRPLRLALGLALVAALVALLVAQRRAILARPETVKRVRAKLEHAEALVPHTLPERKLFRLVSLTAGVCEEIFFRGFMIWYLGIWMGPIAAVILSSILFGFGHIYMGAAQVPKTAILGLILALIALGSGSLWPVILLHAAIDWTSGELGFKILGESSKTAES